MPTPYYDANDGHPGYLLLNDGYGRFREATPGSGLETKRFRRTYSASWIDLDDDGDLDLVNVSDFAGVDLFLNDGRGHFTDATSSLAEPKLFGMAHALTDFDGDGRPDLLAIGMNSPVADRLEHLGLGLPSFPEHRRARAAMSFGNRLWLNRGGGRFEPATPMPALNRTGWAWGVAVEDYDNDGDLDVYVVNGHKSLASVRDYDPQFWTHDIHLGGSTNLDPGLKTYFEAQATRRYARGDSYGGHQHNRFLMRKADGGYYEVAWLLGLALPEDCRNVVAADLDLDGRLDLVVTMVDFRQQPARHELRLYRNTDPKETGFGRHWDVALGVKWVATLSCKRATESTGTGP